jgi:hypothetical protein
VTTDRFFDHCASIASVEVAKKGGQDQSERQRFHDLSFPGLELGTVVRFRV